MFLWFGRGWSDGRFPIVSVAMASVVSYAGGAMGSARIGAMAAAGGMAAVGGMAAAMVLLSAVV
jgi:hypothetical protein